VSRGEARYRWAHAILREDVRGRRISVTFRELAPDFLPGGEHEDMGARMLDVARRFEGSVC
jgi:hypothetical protein